MKRWEYKQQGLRETYPKSVLEVLNSLGLEGWELILILDDTFMYLKRELP